MLICNFIFKVKSTISALTQTSKALMQEKDLKSIHLFSTLRNYDP